MNMRHLIQCLLGTMLLFSAFFSNSQTLNSYPRIEIDKRQVYSISAFPYFDYFTCLNKEPQGTNVVEYLQNDPTFRQSLKRVAGEAATRQYRYLHNLPAKRAFFSHEVNTGRFPQKEQVPFGADQIYRYSYQYLRQPKTAYQYDFATSKLYKEIFDKGSQRHWLLVGITFFKRESDWKVEPLSALGESAILLSLDIKQIETAATERDVYDHALKSTQVYFLKAAENCKN